MNKQIANIAFLENDMRVNLNAYYKVHFARIVARRIWGFYEIQKRGLTIKTYKLRLFISLYELCRDVIFKSNFD